MTRYRIGLLVTLALALLVAPLAAEAQQPTKVPQIGVLLSIPNPELFQEQFREGLRELGYTEGQNIRVDYRWAAAKQVDRLNDLAAELVRLKVDLIVALYTPSAHAAKRATTSLPIASSPAIHSEQAWSQASPARMGTSRGSRSSGQISGASALNCSGRSCQP